MTRPRQHADYGSLVRPSDDLDLFTEFCSTLKTQDLDQFRLEDFQRLCLCDYFLGATVSVIIQPKKQGKTTLIATLCLFHVLTTNDANVVIVAVSKEQAKRLYEHICKFIVKNPDLRSSFDIKTGFNEIRATHDRGIIKVLSADVETLEGIEPTLAVVDEFGQFSSGESWGPLNEGLDTRAGQIVVITNAGSSELSPLGRLRERLQEHGVDRHGTYRHSRSVDGSAVLHEWALDPGDDFEDLEVVKLASPASWTTVDVLRRRRGETLYTTRWQRFSCGLWVRSDDSAIKPTEWDELEDASVVIPPGAGVWIGMDLGWTGDATAIVPLWFESESRRVVGTPIILEPAGDGESLSDLAIDAALLHLTGVERFDRRRFESALRREKAPESITRWADAIEQAPFGLRVEGVVYDPNAGGETIASQFQRKHKITFQKFVQENSNLARADSSLMEAIRRRELVHNGHALLREHALNAVEITDARERSYFGHGKGARRPMDALRALSMAHDAALVNGSRPKRSRVPVFL